MGILLSARMVIRGRGYIYVQHSLTKIISHVWMNTILWVTSTSTKVTVDMFDFMVMAMSLVMLMEILLQPQSALALSSSDTHCRK